MPDHSLRRAPWLEFPIRLDPEPRGMLRNSEASLLYWLAREAYSGCGAIIDAGSFLGKSASYLAHGLRDNPSFAPERDRIHCFDNFVVNERRTVGYLREVFSIERRIGDSTRDLFESQVAPVRQQLVIHEGDFHTIPWERQPVEILLVDLAKSPGLGSRVVDLFFRDLVPGKSLVIHQDYHHPWLPHIHVAMEFLAPWFELAVPRCDDSAVFRLRESMPEAAVRIVVENRFTTNERLDLMDRAIQRLPATDRHYVALARAVLLGELFGWQVARDSIADVAVRYADCAADSAWADYLNGTRVSIEESLGWQYKAKGDTVATLQSADTLRALDPDHPSPAVMRGWALRTMGRHAESESVLREALHAPLRSGFLYRELAETLWEQQRYREAEQTLYEGFADKAATPRVATVSILQSLGHLWELERNIVAIRKGTEWLAHHLADDAECWAFLTVVHSRLGDPIKAMQSLQQARSLGLPPDRENAIRLAAGLPADGQPADGQPSTSTLRVSRN